MHSILKKTANVTAAGNMNVCISPGSTPSELVLAPSGSRTRDSGAGGGRSNKERQRLQPLASVARAPLFEVRGVRFTHSLTGIHPLHVHELFYLIGVILMFCFLT